LSLGNSAREPVKNESVGTLGGVEVLFDQVNDEFVRDEAARLHDGLGFPGFSHNMIQGINFPISVPAVTAARSMSPVAR
jgi:hypothetical protein